MKGLIYNIEDVPKWYICILFGFQHYLAMLSGTIAYPHMLAPKLCLADDSPYRGHLISTTFLVSGLATLLQSTFGSRLPIIQGNSFSFLLPSLAILSLPQWKCDWSCLANNTMNETDSSNFNETRLLCSNISDDDENSAWKLRIREIQGAIITASIVEFLLGLTGLVGFFIKYVSPVAISPLICLIGLSLFRQAGEMASSNWPVAIGTMALLVIFSQYLDKLKMPLLTYSRTSMWTTKRFQIFKLFPVFLAIMISWLICLGMTKFNIISTDNKARTDIRYNVLRKSPWLRIPYPGQWRWPTFSVGAICGMLCGLVCSIVESIGDYYACAKLSGAPPPPTHAVNRGIATEGLGCLLAGIFGSGNALTSFSQNVAAIGITKVGSRRVIQWAAVIMITLSVFSKFGSFFIIIPGPIMGGLFPFMFSMVSGVGLCTLQYVDLNSSRNIFIIGISVFMGLMIPDWFSRHPDSINTGSLFIDQLFTVLLSTGIFVGGGIGIFLDNTIKGTNAEGGILQWNETMREIPREDLNDFNEFKKCTDRVYDVPIAKSFLERFPCLSKIPISHTFK